MKMSKCNPPFQNAAYGPDFRDWWIFFHAVNCTCGFHQTNPSTKTHTNLCRTSYTYLTSHDTSHRVSLRHVIAGRVDQWNWYCYRHTARSGGMFTTSCIDVYCMHHSLFSVHPRVTTSTTTIPLLTMKPT